MNVLNVDGNAIDYGAATSGPARQRCLDGSRLHRPDLRREAHHISIDQTYGPVFGPTHLDRAGQDAVEDGQQVSGRAADDLEDLRRRDLMLQRLAEVAVAVLQLSEEARILQRDHRLVGERLQKGGVGLGERGVLGAQQDDGSDRDVLAQERDREGVRYPNRRDNTLASG